MKNLKKHGIAALAAVIVFTAAGCGDKTSGSPSSPSHSHIWGAWDAETPATCIATGTGTRVCTGCGETDSNTTIPIDPDAHEWDYLEGTEPTCTTDGEGSRECELCGGKETGTAFPAHGHKWGGWEQTAGPTCIAAGVKTRICTVCDETDTETQAGDPIDPEAHDGGGWTETSAPTFITEGVETGTCTRCGTSGTRAGSPPLLITNTAQWTTALSQLDGKTGAYTLTVGGDVEAAGSTGYSFGDTAAGSGLSVTLKGEGRLYLTSRGNLLRVGGGQTLVIDGQNLALEGLTEGKNGAEEDNDAPAVYVGTDGTLELRNGTISGNSNNDYNDYNNYNGGGGVYVASVYDDEQVWVGSGTFTMNGGTISGNTASSGGGVCADIRAAFTMNNGEISGNTASSGGGVFVSSGGTFTMNGGTISGNTAESEYYGGGGGVCAFRGGTFTMNGGSVSGNSAKYGGGVLAEAFSSFTMHGGSVSGNSAEYGGGVCAGYVEPGTFRIVTGTVYGSDGAVSLRNTAGTSGAALYGWESDSFDRVQVQYGTFSGTEWVGTDLPLTADADGWGYTDDTIRVVNGNLQ